jgi:hypothetical protein
MRILLSSYRLDYSGVPTYTWTIMRELHRQGHDVRVYAPEGGQFASAFPWSSSIPTEWRPDRILAQHTPCAIALREAFPAQPITYISHGVTPDIDQPPVDAGITHWVAINEQVRDYLQTHQIAARDISVIRNPVDTCHYYPLRTPLRQTPQVLFVSNYKKWLNYGRLSKACAKLKWSLHAVGSPYRRSRDMVRDMNDADLIVSWGRGILEAMSCGRAVCSFDKSPPAGDGYLDEPTYYYSRTHNFSHFVAGDCRHENFTVDMMVEHLQRYHPADGVRNRELIETYHDVRDAVAALLRASTP